MRTEQIMCLNRGRSKGEDCGHVKPPVKYFSLTVPRRFFCHGLFCYSSSLNVSVAYIFFVLDSYLATLWESYCPFGFLLVMFPLGSSYFVFVFLSF